MTDELRAKFEVWWQRLLQTPGSTSYNSQMPAEGDYRGTALLAYEAAHASRDTEVEALKRDAERYRWLRAATNRDWAIGKDSEKGGVYQYYGQDVDAAIDAAMAKEAGK